MFKRVNRKIRRRTRVARIFHSAASRLGLVRALTIGIHRNRPGAIRYPNMAYLRNHEKEVLSQAA